MWQKKSLKDLCSIFADGDWIEKKDQSVDGIRLVQTGNIKMGYFAERQDKARYISEETFNRLNCTEVKRGDILVSRLPDPVGRASIIPKLKDKAITAVDCTIIRLKEEILPTYLNHYMQSPQYLSSIKLKVTGATRQRISRKNLGEIPINFPPIAEQERIVAKLDTAFAEIDRAVEVAKEGLENINVLQKNYIDDLFKSISGEKTILENVTSALTCGVAKRPNYTDEGVPFLSARNVKNGKMKWENYKYVDNDTHLKLTKYNKPEIGDILYSRVGAGFGDAAIIDKNIEFSIFVSLTLIKPDKELHNEYLCHYLNSSFVKKLAASSITGTGVGNLNVGAVRKFPITVISKEQQILVSEKINVFLKKLDKLKFINKKKINSLQALKSAILAQELQSSEAA